MSLNTAKLKQDLDDLYTATQLGTGSAEDNKEAFLNGMVAALEAFVKSGSIQYMGGLTAGSTPVTGTINGTIV